MVQIPQLHFFDTLRNTTTFSYNNKRSQISNMLNAADLYQRYESAAFNMLDYEKNYLNLEFKKNK